MSVDFTYERIGDKHIKYIAHSDGRCWSISAAHREPSLAWARHDFEHDKEAWGRESIYCGGIPLKDSPAEAAEVLRKAVAYVKNVSENTLNTDADFADYDLLEELENLLRQVENVDS